ncbi:MULTISPECIES: FAD-binding oxidoreductase [unclassified Sphingopyxis]|uniref:FAD-binding oxidoreductase n=1 Tax=unclassified Sphingopyxis TaxID=2614943 RepID=UPI0007309257|nr:MULTISPECIES: FAD-binding oxidoreductase [unclassified Sphingopyxis]KTE02051.1 hydroxyacid dehydrogenase [Sphingopyxis sp. H012]KTE09800.1 hydroxyacid dehydrogenase [Sphingopyxis sp. H053]KTE15194.1 hydroxyacid dehydrogenase [Sphingopyxis sp. H093]KTE29901.1 hydroxyacid dehydrogenase [Sphingopyxis sp. H080]KTE32869.1 hydroxyacid dehydrogenase [Sphingopyxis sp. H038]
MTRPPSASLLDAFANLLGPKGYSADPDAMAPWLTDWRGKYHGRAAAMLSPASTDEVASIVRLCAEAEVALVPQGGNSGMVGGATPDASGDQLLLSLRRLNRIRHIDEAGQLAVAEAGVILENFHNAILAHGLRFPLTLGGKGSATIGGLVSTNAGGTQVLRHGSMRALVAGIEAVLPDGSIFDGLAPLKKDNRGYDLRHLFCGAEGTLGIVTAASLRLVPAAAARRTAWIGIDSPESALLLLRQVDAAIGRELEGFELIPDACLDAVLRHIPQTRAPLATAQPWYVLLELAGESDQALGEALERQLAAALDAGLIRDVVIAKSDRESEDFWRLRDSISEAERAEGPALQHDISVPVDLMPTFIAENPARLNSVFSGARALSFGHLGDGNVHHHVQPPADADGAAWLAEHGAAVSRLVYSHVLELGGSISAEHGIGQMKRDILAELDSPARLSALRGVKAGLDPAGIFNPGKLVA